MGYVAAGKMTAEIIYQMLTLRLITSLSLIVPLCLYLSMFMALGRFQRDNELVSIATAGLGNRFYFSSILQLASLFSILLFFLTMYIFPWAEKNIDLLQQKANRESDITGIKAGSFKEFNRGNRVLYVEKFNRKTKTMENVFLQVNEQGKTGVLTSDSATIKTNEKTGERFVIFLDGKRYVGTPNQLDYSITEFHRYSLKLEQQGYDTTFHPISRAPSKALLYNWRENNDPTSVTELQWRLSTPVSILLLSAFAILAVRLQKDTKGSLLFISAILVFFIYNNLLNISHDFVNRGKAPAFPGLWWPHLLMMLSNLSLVFLPKIKQQISITKK